MRYRFITRLVLLAILVAPITAQEPFERPSIHQIESEYFKRHPELVGTVGAIPAQLLKTPAAAIPVTNKIIYGFHPYWVSTSSAQNYQYDLLSHVAYFDAEADANGGFSTTQGWATTSVVNTVKAAGRKVHLTITMFANHELVLNNATKRGLLVKNIVTEMNRRGGDGVNIDFESMPSTVEAGWKTFVVHLGDTLKLLGKELVVELPAVDWRGNLFDADFFSRTQSRVDYYFLMAYDYWWKGSSTAGPVAPLQSRSVTTSWHAVRSILTYLAKGCLPEKLIAGFPYYGLDWPVTNEGRMASATANASARFYYSIRGNYLDTIPASNKFFDATYNVPWYRYQTTQWRQTWYDDDRSLAMKYDTVKALNLGGTGMWALGYDAPYPELWDALRAAFASPDTQIPIDPVLPLEFRLRQNYPNPFNPGTTLTFTVSEPAFVTLEVYDVIGRRVRTIYEGVAEPDKLNAVYFDASGLPSGIYVARLRSGALVESRKMSLAR